MVLSPAGFPIVNMPNIASVLKSEISRIARKEGRSETDALRRSVSAHRSDIATLKRRVSELEKLLKAVARTSARGAIASPQGDDETEADGLRFRAKGMASNRKRLGLSAEDFGQLVGATGQSVYSWEAGKTKPRAKNLKAIAELRGVGKREVAKRLAALK